MRDDRPRYTFGDTPVAARRLQLLSDVLEPSTRAFLAEAAPGSPDVALDLGCGPGASTRLVAQVTGARRTIGVDTSDSFFELASKRTVPVAAPTAARIYELNLMMWRDDPHVRERHTADALDDLARDLAALARSTSTDPVTWGVRQVAYERDAPAVPDR